MPYANPNSPGYLTAADIYARHILSTQAQDYLRRMEQESEKRRFLQQRYPGMIQEGSIIGSQIGPNIGHNVYAPRIRSGRTRGYGYPYSGYGVPEGGYAPRVVARGVAPAAVAPVQQLPTARLSRPDADWSPPMTTAEIIAEQRAAGTAPTPIESPGYMPTHSGYMYSGTKGGFEDELAWRDYLLSEGGIPKEELADWGAPSVYD